AAAAAEHPGLALILAPRHPERVDEVLSLIAARGLRAVRRSALPVGRAAGAIIVVDTVGELAQMYAVADVVFVGGSLVPLGGHNVLEPALRRKPVLMGPHTDNFREAAGLLTASGGALVVHDAASLGFELRRLLADPGLAAQRGEAGFESLAAQHGAVRQTLELVARGMLKGRGLGVPVVSVGNLTVGGTGKTPAVELAVRTLMELGHRPAVVSRGYGRRGHGIQVVADAASIRLDADEGGDEPFLLARRLPGVPVVVGAHRYEAGRHAVERFGVSAIVLDDGFQHRTLAKDLEIVMARARAPWGSARL